jgi:aryl-alcohol dehydrogenase-like predicted oxidoreductase
MRYVDAAGMRVSAIGLGTWQFGSMEWGYGKDFLEQQAVPITQRALDLGINLLDTAEAYGWGRSERVVGQAIAGRRAEAFVATKLFPAIPVPAVAERRGRASRERLGIDVIDLYQLHWPNPLFPIPTQVEGLRRLRDVGVIRHVGVSNYRLSKWLEAERALGAPVVSNQVRYSLVDRRAERDLLPHARANDRIVIAYSPLGQGLLSARYDADHPPRNNVRLGNPLFLPDNLERARGLLDALRQVAKAHDATPSQVALAWVLRRPNVVAIPGASSVEQVAANAAAADLDLTDDEDIWLTNESDAFQPVRGLRVVPRIAAGGFRAKVLRK